MLERAPDLLARLVDELFFRIALGPFVRQLVADVLVHLLLQFLRERAVVQDDVLELRRQVDFDCANLRELAKGFRGQGTCAMLNRPTHPVAARVGRHLPQRVEVDRDSGDGPIGQDHPAMR